MRCLIPALILFSSAGTAMAQTPDPEQLDTLTRAEEQAREKAAQLSRQRDTVRSDIDALKKELVKTGAESQGFEREGQSLETRLNELSLETERLNAAIYSDRDALMRLLAALQRIENNPPPPLATNPKDATEAARAATLMVVISENLQSRAKTLSDQLSALDTLRKEVNSKKESLSANSIALEKRRSRINALVRQKSSLEKSIAQDRETAQKDVTRLANEAQTLRDLIESFEASTADITPRVKPGISNSAGTTTLRRSVPSPAVKLPKGVTTFAKAKGKLRAPVQGQVTRQYGSGEKGVTIQTRSGAQVISPYAGRIEFAGAFKNYDYVVILNVGGGYFILMTGIGETYVETDENVTIGEPLGLMPFNEKGRTDLYIEFRQNGSTINPKPWLGAALATG